MAAKVTPTSLFRCGGTVPGFRRGPRVTLRSLPPEFGFTSAAARVPDL